jgi:hypothetical protein
MLVAEQSLNCFGTKLNLCNLMILDVGKGQDAPQIIFFLLSTEMVLPWISALTYYRSSVATLNCQLF